MPADLIKIINNYIETYKLLDIFKIFAKKYKLSGSPNLPIIKPTQYLEKNNMDELNGICIEFYYKDCDKIHTTEAEMKNCRCYSENGFGVDNSDDDEDDNETAKVGYTIGDDKGMYWSPDNKTFPFDNYIKFDTSDFDQWVIPSDFQLFINRYRGFVFGDPNLSFSYPDFDVTTEYEYIIQYFGFKDNMTEFKVNEWRTFYQDGNSVDCGCGVLIMNLNPKSSQFGYVLSYSSNDEGTISFVAKSFTQLIEKLNEYPGTAKSLCDLLNGLESDDELFMSN